LPVSLPLTLKICDALGQQHVDLRFTPCERLRAGQKVRQAPIELRRFVRAGGRHGLDALVAEVQQGTKHVSCIADKNHLADPPSLQHFTTFYCVLMGRPRTVFDDQVGVVDSLLP
jgi:hypothetical protein